ncbi:alpha/beta hydrolase [Brevundimonas sp. LM2]|uniref:alpha/beta hydrolase n=1 Tax=Brevundimonas sp. LM2 TaxID=1938605 RepID=UPI00098408A9|nr:alpha/beta hydrolase [Brevundimonas sp. LM2]AQR62850.1 alpha/beta hydrolase [Brevundimonas sp. LM2]
MLKTLLAAGLALLGLAAAAPAAAGDPVYVVKDCPADWPTDVRTVECGTLTVDETRGAADSRRIDIAVVRVRASRPFQDANGQALPPVVVFHGGPGGALVGGVGRRLGFWRDRPDADPMAAIDQDWIYFDQRGGGQSTPSMDCPGVELTDAGLPSAQDAEGLTDCLKRYADQGVQLSQYNAAVIAQDVADLARALGLPKVDLYGGSYGPRIQAAVITHAPQIVRVAVMDSPWPPEGNWAVHTPEQVATAVRIILGKCAAQSECDARHPNLTARFEANAREWLAGPRTGADGKARTVEDLAAFLMDTTYDRQGVRRLPADLEKIIGGDLSPVAAIAEDRTYYFEGQHMAHLCKEELPFESKAALVAGAAGDPIAEVSVPSLSRLFDVCAAIDVGAADPVENAPVHTAIPTLFIAAEIDPGCPPALTRAAAANYRDSQVMIVTNATHGVTGQNACAARAARDFLRDPTKAVDQTCLPAADTPLVFSED